MAHPALFQIISSAIVAYRYSPDPDLIGGNLVIEFWGSGKFYRYVVDAQEYRDFELAPSKGTFVNSLKKFATCFEMTYDEVAAYQFNVLPAAKVKKKRRLMTYEKAFSIFPDFANFF